MIGVLENTRFGSTFNTVLGGIAPLNITEVATVLGIQPYEITFLKYDKSDILLRIETDYNIPNGAFVNHPLTSFIDKEGKVLSVGADSFLKLSGDKNINKLKDVSLPKASSVGSQSFRRNEGLETIYLPEVVDYGSTLNDDGVFDFINPDCIIYANESMETINGGSAEGDLADAISLGAEVRYIYSKESPSRVTDLSIGEIHATTVQLNFTPPASLNTIDFYEVYQGGKKLGVVQAPGDYLIGLNPDTTYEINLIAVDQFYNKSRSSKTISVKTTTTEVSTNNLVSSFGFEGSTGEVLDLAGGHNGLINGTITRGVTGLVSVGNCFDFGGGEVRVPHSKKFNLHDGTSNKNLAFSIWFQLDATTSLFWLFSKRGSVTEYQVLYNSSISAIRFVLFNNDGTNVYLDIPYTPVIGDKIHLAGFTNFYKGQIKLFLNGSEGSNTVQGTFKTLRSTTEDFVIGRDGGSTNGSFPGKIDENRIWIGDLVPEKEYLLKEYNAGNGITL